MAVNLIVLAVTLLMGMFIAIWCFCPWLRPWMEAPKYRFLKQGATNPATLKDDDPPSTP